VGSYGVVEEASGRGRHDHVCWAYEDRAALAGQVVGFLSEGLAAGQRVCYAAADATDPIARRLRESDGFTEAEERGAASVVPADSVYEPDTVIDPYEQVRIYAALTDAALAAGLAGLRVAADATALVRTPAQVDAFARCEHLIDRYMVDRPYAALCAYDRAALTDFTVAQLVCMHPLANTDVGLFRLHACPPADGAAALAGELDMTTEVLFPLALDRADLRPTAGRLVFDARELRFIDYHSVLEVADYARRRDATAVLRTSSRGASHLADLLGVDSVIVESAG
jgi:hypothetical protein